MHLNKTTSLLIAAVSGFVYLYFVRAIAWGFIPDINPISDWLIQNHASAVWFRPVLYLHDFIINTILAAPLAILIYYLRPPAYTLYVFVAVVPGFIWTNLVWLDSPGFTQVWPHVLTSWAMSLACLPIALVTVVWFSRGRA